MKQNQTKSMKEVTDSRHLQIRKKKDLKRDIITQKCGFFQIFY